MSSPFAAVDAARLLASVAAQIPAALRDHLVVIGSIATAWAYRDISGTATVATKDIDLLLHPADKAVAIAQALGQVLLDAGWVAQFSQGRSAGVGDTLTERLPTLRLRPPAGDDDWYVELLGTPPAEQRSRKAWRRFETPQGTFGLPSFHFMPIAAHGAESTPIGMFVAQPACMALAHLLEHAVPDRTPISTLRGYLRFQKDLGRAVSLWWLANAQTSQAASVWLCAWRAALVAFDPGKRAQWIAAAVSGLRSLRDDLDAAHRLSLLGVLAPHGTTFTDYAQAYRSLDQLLIRAAADASE